MGRSIASAHNHVIDIRGTKWNTEERGHSRKATVELSTRQTIIQKSGCRSVFLLKDKEEIWRFSTFLVWPKIPDSPIWILVLFVARENKSLAGEFIRW